jgi:hypothetical protein
VGREDVQLPKKFLFDKIERCGGGNRQRFSLFGRSQKDLTDTFGMAIQKFWDKFSAHDEEFRGLLEIRSLEEIFPTTIAAIGFTGNHFQNDLSCEDFNLR